MKNELTLRQMAGLAAIVALIGLAAVSCDNATTANGAIYHTVSFHTDGSGVPPAQVRHGYPAAEPEQDPTRGSYAFAGWYVAASGGAAFDFGVPITGNTTVYARWIAPYPTLEAEISAGITLEMNWILAGAFTMGQAGVATPEREVTLTRGFYMGIHPVTQEQFHAVMGHNPSGFSGSPASGEAQGRRPVEMVNWYHAIAFANLLSIQQGLEPAYHVAGVNWEALMFADVPTSRDDDWDAATVNWNAGGFRLATEAEWEFAARAGTATQWSFGDTDDDIDYYAWTNRNSNGMTREAGRLRSNAWGLYDMHGNVWEWVWDRFGAFDANPATNPTGAAAGGSRVVRGGSWVDAPELARSAFRFDGLPVFRFSVLGFRVVRP